MYSTDQSFKKLAKLNLHLIILVLSFIGNAQTQSAHLKESYCLLDNPTWQVELVI